MRNQAFQTLPGSTCLTAIKLERICSNAVLFSLCRNPSFCRAMKGPSLRLNTTEKVTCCSLWPRTRYVPFTWSRIHFGLKVVVFVVCAVEGPNTPVSCLLGCDVLFACVCVLSLPQFVNVWYSVNGERLGTYNGHTGAVWCVDVDCILHCRLLSF